MSEKIPTNKNIEFHHDEIGELEEPIKKILEQISSKFEKGEYDLMIGIDASGRIPALIIFKVAEHIYQKRKIAVPLFRFVAGDAAPKSELKKVISGWNPRKKVLIVDDIVHSGESIAGLVGVLDDLNIQYDVAAIDATGYFYDFIEGQRVKPKNIFSANSAEAYSINRKWHLHGVQTDIDSEGYSKGVFSKKYDKDSRRAELDASRPGTEFKPDSRKDVDSVAQHLIDWYEGQKNEE